MKLKFKHQPYQAAAVDAVADCFAGQPRSTGEDYRLDPGRAPSPQRSLLDDAGFRNHPIRLDDAALLANLQAAQRRANLALSDALVPSKASRLNLDVEMETGTGKTYVYIKTLFELHRRFGWGKFVIVVPSIAIREGVLKSFRITAEHFLADYGQRARFFVYDSRHLHQLEAFSSDAGINAMIINVQAFHARGKDARRIYEELDDFQSRKPIDVIRANRPILILDEPQKMEGAKTQAALAEFAPLFVLRCSATHKTRHNQVHRLDALDAYQQKLVKKINVRGITVQGLSGGAAYLYLEAIEVAAGKPPRARLEIEVKRGAGIKRELRLVGRNDDLHALSGELPAYRGGFVVAEIDAHLDLVRFVNGVELTAGDAVGDLTEEALRRIQIREAIRAHLEKEQALFARGVKVLTLFFIDEVARYRRCDDTGEQPQQDFSNAVRAERHVFDYVFTDSKGEQDFVRELDSCTEVVVYAKLPRGFFIPTPVGNYNPDWAIAFQEGAVKHVYFVAETKGSMSSLQLREIEQRKIDCARRFFSRIASEQVRYDVVDGYDELLTLVQ